jgi:hypothetical protein
MPTYAMLVLPAANRVYAEAAPELMLRELEVFNAVLLGGRLKALEHTRLGGVGYVVFEAPELGTEDLARLGNVSSLYALFRMEGGLLAPLELQRRTLYDDDLITIPKYQGKTNEQFTHLLLNITALASNAAGAMFHRRLQVLDPLCGRGTTLNQAVMYGYDAVGVEIDKRDFDAYEAFLKSWLKRKRLKHTAETSPVRRHKKALGRRLDLTVAPTKESYKAGDTQTLSVINADTLDAGEILRSGSFDLVVADLPYGVQHGSRSPREGLRRAPLDLVAEAAPVWAELLRPGGALGLSFNTYTADYDDLAVELTESGLEVCIADEFRAFAHRVDQAIHRDLIVARKPA